MRGRIEAFLAVSLLATGGGFAQESPVVLEFSFSNPGARALGLGGAFAALADDATAAFANPAGLVQLSRPEVSAEGRLWNYATPFTLGGRFDGSEPTGILLDTTSGLRFGESSQSLGGLSFLSFVYPREDWSIALYRHQSAKFEFRSETQGLFAQAPPPFTGARREIDLRSSIELDVVSHGVSTAYRLADTLSLGLGISYVQGKFESRADLFFPTEANLREGFFGPSAYDPESRFLRGELGIDDSDWTFNFGALWHPSRQWSLGGFFRQGPEFLLKEETRAGPLRFDLPEGAVESGFSPVGFPNVFGLAVAFKSGNEALTVLAEWDRVQYSRILHSLDQQVFDTEGSAIDDANELRFGLEYAFLNWTPVVALRLGTWLDPDHRFRDVGDDPLGRTIFRAGDDELHVTAGAGIAFQNFQIDVGLDLSDVVDTLSVSAVLSF